jgi:alpha-L-arabinofuranosidase
MTISGQPDDENNFDKQPIAPVKETIPMKKRMDVEVAPYSFSLITIKL